MAVAVSGGVDSLCAMLRLLHAGYEVLAFHCIFAGVSRRSRDISQKRTDNLRAICARLSVPFFLADFADVFAAEVVQPFLTARLAGETPNPCVFCNQKIKFSLLPEYVMALGADLLATGHYTSLCANPYGGHLPLLQKTANIKDQTYFLSLVSGHWLTRLVFPLAGLEKSECRALVRDFGLAPPDSRESQDICFMENDSSGNSAARNRLEAVPGPIMLHGREIAIHNGICNYTIGQRKGLGIPWRAPLYVLEKDIEKNVLHVAEREEVMMRGIKVKMANFFVPLPDWPDTVLVQWRHGGAPVRCSLEAKENGCEVLLEKPFFPTAKGQICAFYDTAGRLLGGGMVRKTLNAAGRDFPL